MKAAGGRSVRLVLAVALASGLTWAICHGIGLSSATPYGVVIAALFIRPGFDRWPPAMVVLLPLLIIVGLSLGTALRPLLEAPEVWQFAVITAIAQLLAQALPDRLMKVRSLLAVLAVLPLLSSNPTWLAAWQQLLAVLVGMGVATLIQAGLRLPGDLAAGADRDGGAAGEAADAGEGQARAPAQAGSAVSPQASAPAQDGEQDQATARPQPAAAQEKAAAQEEPELPARSLAQRLADPFFWRKLVVSTLALSIGLGVGAVTPKYLYFGVVLLLNDSLGATLERVRDRMVGVSLGVLMPLLVFNTQPIDALSVALVMGGTTALLLALRLQPHLSTALISSGVTFVGYGALAQWYVPHRWIDYLLGCALALLVCLLVRPISALKRFRQLADGADAMTPELSALLPSALEEARLLGQERPFRARLERLERGGG